jgi:hypothetical protein
MKQIIKYELVTSLYKNFKVFLGEYESYYTPNVGDIVNIEGNPFCVYRIGAAHNSSSENKTYVYVSVFKAGSFELEIGGEKY